MQDSLVFVQNETEDIKTQLATRASSDLSVAVEGTGPAPEKLSTIEKSVQQLEQQNDYMENQSRINNIRIDFIPEESGET